jgi:hypothetical protein
MPDVPALALSAKGADSKIHFGDSQNNVGCRGLFEDSSFCRGGSGNINRRKFYNLFIPVGKSCYIDSFRGRTANASVSVGELAYDIGIQRKNWFLT